MPGAIRNALPDDGSVIHGMLITNMQNRRRPDADFEPAHFNDWLPPKLSLFAQQVISSCRLQVG